MSSQRYLIVSDSNGEGAFIAEVASRTGGRPGGPMVMRASKFFFESNWFGGSYRLTHSDAAESLAGIEQMGIAYVVIDSTPNLSQLPHWEQVRRMMRENPDRLQLVGQFPAGEHRRVRFLNIYQVLHFANPPTRKFEFQTIYTRGGNICE